MAVTPQIRPRPDTSPTSGKGIGIGIGIGRLSRLDAHNITIDEDAAARHQCGTRHLATGRVCHLPERHRGGCQFD